MKINQGFLNLKDRYLFSLVAQKVGEYRAQNPGKEVISLGIGDVTLPLAPVVVEAMQKAVAEMGRAETFRGYGEEQGYAFLRQAVCSCYARKGVELDASEVFIGDGAKSDLGNILDIFAQENTVLIQDPVYPAYVAANIMAGRRIHFLDGTVHNSFLPLPHRDLRADIVYLCSPNNPTGAVYTKEQLKIWVDWALAHDAVILFDSAYEAFIQDGELPTSIYQIDGAKRCAIEFCSLSKTAGFTGVRCGYTVVPHELIQGGVSLNELWLRRQSTKFNGVSYVTQRGAEAAFTPEGLEQNRTSILYYLENARL
ncbi:MAG: LL-diaminopimelate aminotransferase, partial [Firmicutes bacterium]|nr:LL-diaminopimelate aminotransferase [Bacillota bacterium]